MKGVVFRKGMYYLSFGRHFYIWNIVMASKKNTLVFILTRFPKTYWSVERFSMQTVPSHAMFFCSICSFCLERICFCCFCMQLAKFSLSKLISNVHFSTDLFLNHYQTWVYLFNIFSIFCNFLTAHPHSTFVQLSVLLVLTI